MTVKVKAGTPDGVHSSIPNRPGKAVVKDFDESKERSRPTNVTELRGRGKGDVTIEVGSTEIFQKHPTTRKPGHAAERVFVEDRIYTDNRAEIFLGQMEEGFSTEEPNQGNPFDPPAVGSTKPRTLSEAMAELVFRFKILMVEIWMPEGYEMVRKQVRVDVKKFIVQAHALWDSYEPLLGRRNTTTVLQVEAPPELEDE